MSRSTYSQGATLPTAELPYERLDEHRREIVDHALRVQQTTNTVSALELLKSHNFTADLIERVLLEPDQRRAISPH